LGPIQTDIYLASSLAWKDTAWWVVQDMFRLSADVSLSQNSQLC